MIDLNDVLEKLKVLAEDETSDIELSLEELDVLHENYEQLDELSKKTLGSYIKKASRDIKKSGEKMGRFDHVADVSPNKTSRDFAELSWTKHDDKSSRRIRNIAKATDRLTKEDVEQLDELSGATLGNYIAKARKHLDANSNKKNFTVDDFEIANKRAQGVDRAGSKLLGGRTEFGPGVKIEYKKPKVRATVKEDVSELISSAVQSKPSEFQNTFADVLRSKISDRVDELKDDIASSIVNEEQLDEISDKKKWDYVDKAQTHGKKVMGILFGKNPPDKEVGSNIAKKSDKRDSIIKKTIKKLTKEDVEQLDELSKKTLGSYIKKAKDDVDSSSYVLGAHSAKNHLSRSLYANHMNTIIKRNNGIDKATDRLTKEDVEQLDELSKKTLSSYIVKATVDKEKNKQKYIDAQSRKFRTQNPLTVKQDKDYGETDKDFAERKYRLQRRIDGADKEIKTADSKMKKRTIGTTLAAQKIITKEINRQ